MSGPLCYIFSVIDNGFRAQNNGQIAAQTAQKKVFFTRFFLILACFFVILGTFFLYFQANLRLENIIFKTLSGLPPTRALPRLAHALAFI